MKTKSTLLCFISLIGTATAQQQAPAHPPPAPIQPPIVEPPIMPVPHAPAIEPIPAPGDPISVSAMPPRDPWEEPPHRETPGPSPSK